MLCEQCNLNPATVLFAEKPAGVLSKRQLCRSCAEPLLERIQPDDIAGATFLTPEDGTPQDLPEEVYIPSPMTVRDFAGLLGLKPFQVIGTLMRLNIFVSLNATLDFETVARVCFRYGVIVHRASEA